MAKKIFISATNQDNGKTTTSLSLLYQARQKYERIGFIKPVGPKPIDFLGRRIDTDPAMIAQVYGQEEGMMKHFVLWCTGIALLGMVAPASAARWRFPVGVSYIGGFEDVIDVLEDNLEAEGFITDSTDSVPVGIAVSPYLQLDSGFAIGGTLGPFMIVTGDVDFFNLPLGVDVRYYPFVSAAASPYLRAGVKYHWADGDYVEKSTPGLVAGVGLEFMRKKIVGLGFEVLYDSSEIEFEDVANGGTKEVKPARIMVSISAIF